MRIVISIDVEKNYDKIQQIVNSVQKVDDFVEIGGGLKTDQIEINLVKRRNPEHYRIL